MPFEASRQQQKLGAELLAARQAKGLSARQVAEEFDWAVTKVTRMERAEVQAATGDVLALARLYELADHVAERLCGMCREGRTNPWWKPYKSRIGDSYYDLIGLENEAVSMQSMHSTVVEGLLQTQEYAGGVMDVSAMVKDLDRTTTLLEVRRLRQRRLFEPEPLELDATLDEAVLSIPYGGDAVLKAQLRHLLEMAKMPNVTIRILPTRVAAERAPVTLYKFVGDQEPEIASVDATFSVLIQEDRFDVSRAASLLRATQASALSPHDSTALIEEKLKES